MGISDSDSKSTHTASHLSSPQFRGKGQQGSGGFKPPPPPLPPTLVGDSNSISSSIRDSVRGYVHDAMKGSVKGSVTDSSRANREDKKMTSSSSSVESNDNVGSGESQVQVPSDSHHRSTRIKKEEIIEPEVIPIPMDVHVPEEKIPEVKIPLKWALEDPSVLVSKRLAGGELYERVLALRAANKIKKVESSGESGDIQMNSDRQNRSQSPSQDVGKDNGGDTTLDDMLASISQSNESISGDRSASSVDDFFGAFAGKLSI